MAYIHIKFDGGKCKIEGEARDSKHEKWLECFDFSHAITQPKSATASSSGGHTAERAEHGDMIFTKHMDLASPKLMEACSAGHTFDEATIHFSRSDGQDNIVFSEIKLKHVIISSVSPTLPESGLPKETFTLTYAAVQWNYTAQASAGGQKGNSSGAWSLAKNTNQYSA